MTQSNNALADDLEYALRDHLEGEISQEDFRLRILDVVTLLRDGEELPRVYNLDPWRVEVAGRVMAQQLTIRDGYNGLMTVNQAAVVAVEAADRLLLELAKGEGKT